MGLLDSIGGLLGATTGGGGAAAAAGGGGGSFLSDLFSPQNLLLGGIAGLNFLSSDAEADRRDEEADRLFNFQQQQFDFQSDQANLDREFAQRKLLADIALSQASAAASAQRANQAAAIQRQQLVQQAFDRLVNSQLQGGGLTTNALGGLSAAAQAPLLR